MNHDDYSSRQSARDAAYERQYREWVESLSPAERRELERQGLAEPYVQHHGTGSARGDAADSPRMRQGDDPMRVPDPEPDVTEPETEHVWDAVRRVLGEVLCHDNARLTAECLAIVSGLCYPGASMTEIARRHGVTRAAVSKRCCELSELLDLRPSRAMRSLTARRRYRSARIQAGPELEREFQFHPKRRWRADFAHLPSRTLIEIEGGIYINGCHNRAAGFAADIEKYLEATLAGWRVIRLGPGEITFDTVGRIKTLLCLPSQGTCSTQGTTGSGPANP